MPSYILLSSKTVHKYLLSSVAPWIIINKPYLAFGDLLYHETILRMLLDTLEHLTTALRSTLKRGLMYS